MIIFKELRWGNIFSYGPNNVLKLNTSPLTQIIGDNGHGKSSIPLIIEEVLYNQNSKKIKKSDILNRYSKDKSYFIELDFDKDNTEYTIKTVRSSTVTNVKLFRDGKDISNHTATGTFKNIEIILGYDYKTFSQIVYQSSLSSLEFLTATDTARKKFLIDLLDLNKYIKICDIFKSLSSELTKRSESVNTKINTIESWIERYSKTDLTIKELLEEPEVSKDKQEQIGVLKNTLANIEAISKKIVQNNKYKEIFNSLVLPSDLLEPIDDSLELKFVSELNHWKNELAKGSKLTNKGGATYKCTSCGQDVDNSTNHKLVLSFEENRPNIQAQISVIENILEEHRKKKSLYYTEKETITQWEKYHSLIDHTLTSVIPNKHEIVDQINKLEKELTEETNKLNSIRDQNSKITAHNSKANVILSQMESMNQDLKALKEEYFTLLMTLSDYQILIKTFSTTGLVAYKIECLVKDLEELVNEYLAILANGRFQLTFKVSSSDKLNVVINDNGRDVEMCNLSSGERARVNVSTLLAIRKLMQSLSKTRTNLLVLDETIENLDANGKEKLIEILLEEESLNTFVISHGFTHPILEKLKIVKENNISRIDHG